MPWDIRVTLVWAPAWIAPVSPLRGRPPSPAPPSLHLSFLKPQTHVESQHASWRTDPTLLLRLSDTHRNTWLAFKTTHKRICVRNPWKQCWSWRKSGPAFSSNLRPELQKDYETGRRRELVPFHVRICVQTQVSPEVTLYFSSLISSQFFSSEVVCIFNDLVDVKMQQPLKSLRTCRNLFRIVFPCFVRIWSVRLNV